MGKLFIEIHQLTRIYYVALTLVGRYSESFHDSVSALDHRKLINSSRVASNRAFCLARRKQICCLPLPVVRNRRLSSSRLFRFSCVPSMRIRDQQSGSPCVQRNATRASAQARDSPHVESRIRMSRTRQPYPKYAEEQQQAAVAQLRACAECDIPVALDIIATSSARALAIRYSAWRGSYSDQAPEAFS